MSTPLVSVHVIAFHKFQATLRCLASLREHLGEAVEVVLVENASATPTQRQALERLAGDWPVLRPIFLEEPRHCPWIRARVLEQTLGEYVFFLDNDCYLEHDFFPALIAELEKDPSLGGAAPGLLYHPERTYQCLGIELEMEDDIHFHPRHLRHGEPHAAHRHLPPFYSDFIPGGCSLFRRAFLEICRYDEQLKNIFGDFDLCLQGRGIGYRYLFHPGCWLVHDKTSHCPDYMRAKARLTDWLGGVVHFERKWGLRYFILKHLEAGRVVLEGGFPRWLPRAEWPENRCGHEEGAA